MLPSTVNSCRQDNSKAGLKSELNEKHSINTKNTLCKFEISDMNLIDWLDDDGVNRTQKTHVNNKDKEIADYQLKMLEEFCRTSTLTKTYNDLQEAEFRQFFDKYENTKPVKSTHNSEDLHSLEQKTERNQRKLADSLCAFQSNQLTDNLYNSIHDVNVAPKVLESTFEEPQESEGDEMKINEDLIDEVMFEQHLEKQLQVRATLANNKEIKTGFVEVPHTFNTSTDSKNPKEDYSNIFDEIIAGNKMNYLKKAASDSTKTVKFPNPSAVLANDSKEYTNLTKTKLEQKLLTEELVTKYDVKYLETVKKIEKIFQKRSILKSEAEKSKLTPGPSLYEKTVVLPQIMQRLKYMENTSEVKMKLVLDAGPSCTTPTLNCHSSIKTPLNTFSTKQVLHDKSMIKPRLSYDDPSCSTLLDYNKSIKINNSTPIPKSESIKNTLKTPLANIKNLKCALKPPVSENAFEGITILRPPEMLLSDCNKQRLIAHETGKLFNNFVRAGSYYAP